MGTAEIINLNDATPSAASGFQNTTWQKGSTTGNDPTYNYPIFPVSSEVPNTGGVLVKTASYTATAADCGKIIVFNSSSALSLTLPSAIPFAQWCLFVATIGTGGLTVNPNGLQIDGSLSSITGLTQNQGIYVATDGANYFTERGEGGGGSITLTTTGTSGPSTLVGSTLNVPVYQAAPAGSYNVSIGLIGQPLGGSLTLAIFVFSEAVNFASNWSGSVGKVGTNPTVAQTWTLQKNGSSIGTVTISTGGVVGFTTTGGATESFAVDDELALIGSSSADATLANVSLTLQGTRASVTSTPITVVPASWLGPVPGNHIIGLYVVSNQTTFPANWSGAAGKVGTNPTATATFTVYKNGSSVGTVSISTSGVFTFSTTGGASVTFNTNDEMQVQFQSSTDATLADVAITFSGNVGGFVQLAQDLGNTTAAPKVIGINGYSIAVMDDTGSANAYAVSPPFAFTRVKYATLIFKAVNANTGASTLNDGGGAIAIKKGGSIALSGGEISAGQIVECIFDGTYYQLVSWSGASGSGGGNFSPYPASLTPPVSTNFTWSNQGSTTVTDKSNRMVASVPVSVGNLPAQLYNTALPSTPYTIDAAFSMGGLVSADHVVAGILLKNTGGAPLVQFGPDLKSATPGAAVMRWNSVTSFNVFTIDTLASVNPGLIFVRITDDGTTRKYYLSNNGLDFALVYSEATNSWVTPNQTGIGYYNGTSPDVLVASSYHFLVSNSILPQFT